MGDHPLTPTAFDSFCISLLKRKRRKPSSFTLICYAQTTIWRDFLHALQPWAIISQSKSWQVDRGAPGTEGEGWCCSMRQLFSHFLSCFRSNGQSLTHFAIICSQNNGQDLRTKAISRKQGAQIRFVLIWQFNSGGFYEASHCQE